MRQGPAVNRKNFKAALAEAGMTADQWRTISYKALTGKTVSKHHLNECFAGRRVMGPGLRTALARFIKANLGA